MSSNADIEKRWQIKGQYENGSKLAFPVQAFDHAEAKKKAEAKLPKGARIDSIVLIEPRKKWI